VMQQAEVQQVTFSSGIGVGGSATLTYHDLYGQSWTTRPIDLGDGLHYVLDYALGTSLTAAADASEAYLALTYGGATVNTGVNTITTVTAAVIREKLLTLSTIGDATDLAKSIRVTKRPHATSHKFSAGIEPSCKLTFDIYINPNYFTGLSEAGGLKEFTASLQQSGGGASTQVADGKAYVNVRLVSDASAAIKGALESLPNSAIPSVSVSKSGYTTASTSDQGAYGNAYHQTYDITFSSGSNTGDQNMLSCDATPCDDDGCLNRRHGVSSVMYLHHDYTFGAKSAAAAPGASSTSITKKVPKVNFQGQGYFIIDIHRDSQTTAAALDFSAGDAFVEWNTGAGVERAEFPVIATAATVQTALRGISGWSGVTVTSHCQTATCDSTKLTKAHAYTVTFPSGYDDGGQTPRVGLVSGFGGNGASDGVAIVYDQRFSNSLWLGDITGWTPVLCRRSDQGANPIVSDYCNYGTANSDATIQGEYGDNMIMSLVHFGYTNQVHAQANTVFSQAKQATFSNVHFGTSDFGLGITKLNADNIKASVVVDNSKAFPTATSQNTGDYFAVGSTIEVLDTTWDLNEAETDVTVTDNVYRSFKVLSHVSNVHGQTFAKLDSIPTTASSTNYALKVTTHNSTITARTGITLHAHKQEVQEILSIASNVQATHADDQYRIYINANKPNVEFTEILEGDSTPAAIAEAINSFGALSGPVSVARAGALDKIAVTFAEIDGDVPQLTVEKLVDGGNSVVMSTDTMKQGWSFTAGASAKLENVAPGSVINITSRETVTFTISGTWNAGNLVASYDGNVGSVSMANNGAAAGVVAMINSIKTESGSGARAKFALVTGDVTSHSASSIVINMPAGVDASKLELIPDKSFAGTGISKSIAKNNNGKSFKVLRTMNQEWDLTTPDASGATSITHNKDNKGPLVIGDEIKASQATAGEKCAYHEDLANTAAIVYYDYLPISAVTSTAGTSTAYTIAPTEAATAAGCVFKVYRTTLVVDSEPDTFTAGLNSVDMTIHGPTGSCSVSETVKGTYESAVCANRGSCDGASGLCTCHEGYSGEACETQTVLV